MYLKIFNAIAFPKCALILLRCQNPQRDQQHQSDEETICVHWGVCLMDELRSVYFLPFVLTRSIEISGGEVVVKLKKTFGHK